LRVADLERSARFYRDVAGVPLARQDPHEPLWVDHYETMLGNVYFALFPAGPEDATRRAEVGFSVQDLDVTHRAAEQAGAAVVVAPRQRPWGRTASYLDPDGNVVSLTEVG
jgi:predicted enzyme related to lactoylglutathione lyase